MKFIPFREIMSIWSTQNSGIATVSNSGNVEGVSSGETIVTAKVGSGTVEIRVRVNN